ncbi:hypothetical protein Sjap_025107 [Stephania japonica]|uniref:Uncharacterized protein n=1 Tax=Stephania japonica TaxID=461633 RepID=A0AAP0E175_9MAGN
MKRRCGSFAREYQSLLTHFNLWREVMGSLEKMSRATSLGSLSIEESQLL